MGRVQSPVTLEKEPVVWSGTVQGSTTRETQRKAVPEGQPAGIPIVDVSGPETHVQRGRTTANGKNKESKFSVF